MTLKEIITGGMYQGELYPVDTTYANTDNSSEIEKERINMQMLTPQQMMFQNQQNSQQQAQQNMNQIPQIQQQTPIPNLDPQQQQIATQIGQKVIEKVNGGNMNMNAMPNNQMMMPQMGGMANMTPEQQQMMMMQYMMQQQAAMAKAMKKEEKDEGFFDSPWKCAAAGVAAGLGVMWLGGRLGSDTSELADGLVDALFD